MRTTKEERDAILSTLETTGLIDMADARLIFSDLDEAEARAERAQASADAFERLHAEDLASVLLAMSDVGIACQGPQDGDTMARHIRAHDADLRAELAQEKARADAAERSVGDLLHAMKRWAADEDNEVHPDAWEAYRAGHVLLSWAMADTKAALAPAPPPPSKEQQ